MGKEILTYDDLLQIVELIKSAQSFSEFHLKVGDIEIDLRKSGVATSVVAAVLSERLSAPLDPAALANPVPEAVPQVASSSAQETADFPDGAVIIKSPMVGTFYRCPAPGAKPFVEVGQQVGADTTVCIVEVMKLMNAMTAGCTGKVTHILVNDAEPVGVGQALIVIDPKG